MRSGMYNPPFGASPVRTVWTVARSQRSQGANVSQRTSSKESRSEPPLVEKYFIVLFTDQGSRSKWWMRGMKGG